jgi:hypothetical protein
MRQLAGISIPSLPRGAANGVEYVGYPPGQRPADVRIEIAQEEPDEEVPEPAPAPLPAVAAPVLQGATLGSASTILESAKARLATLDMEIARLEGCKVERRMLAAMVDAAEGKT